MRALFKSRPGSWLWFLTVAALWVLQVVTRLRELGAAESVRRLELSGTEIVLAFGQDALLAAGLWLLGAALLEHVSRSRAAIRLVLATGTCCCVGLAVVETVGHLYLMTTGSMLDAAAAQVATGNAREIAPVVLSEFTPLRWLLLASVSLVPLAMMLLALRRIQPTQNTEEERGRLFVGPGLALGALLLFASFTSLIGDGFSWQRHALALLLPNTVSESGLRLAQDIDYSGLEQTRNVTLVPTGAGETSPNVVLLILESTGQRATSLAANGPDTTPFLSRLAAQGAQAERMHAIVAHTTKALVAILCGIEPLLTSGVGEAVPGALPTPCLPNLLRGAGYETAYFQSAIEWFEKRRQLVAAFGFEEFYPGNQLPQEGFETVNYYGVEDEVLIEPVSDWVASRARSVTGERRPHLLTILTNGPHHDYGRADRYGWREFDVENEMRDSYLNLVAYQDRIVEQIFEEYRRQGLLEDTVFVIVGDHGEAFGEHGLSGHDNVVWDEALHVPFVVFDGRSEKRDSTASRATGVIEGNQTQLDIAPTIIALTDHSVVGGALPGVDLLNAEQVLAERDRPIFASCWFDRKCLAVKRDGLKFIHHFGERPDEVYRMVRDPMEQNRLQLGGSGWVEATPVQGLEPVEPNRIDRLKQELFVWRERAIARYYQDEELLGDVLLESEPEPEFAMSAQFGDSVKFLGYDTKSEPAEEGLVDVEVSLYYKVLKAFDFALEGDEPKRRVRLSTEHVFHRLDDKDPGPGLYALRRWRRGDVVRDRVFFGRVPKNLGLPLFARIGFMMPSSEAAEPSSLEALQALWLEPEWLGEPADHPWARPRIEGRELIVPMTPAMESDVSAWVYRRRDPPQFDFIKKGSWRRFGLNPDGDVRGYISLERDDDGVATVYGWAADTVAYTGVDRVVAFLEGRPIASALPKGEWPLEGYPPNEQLGVGFQLMGKARQAYIDGDLVIVAIKGNKVGRLKRI